MKERHSKQPQQVQHNLKFTVMAGSDPNLQVMEARVCKPTDRRHSHCQKTHPQEAQPLPEDAPTGGTAVARRRTHRRHNRCQKTHPQEAQPLPEDAPTGGTAVARRRTHRRHNRCQKTHPQEAQPLPEDTPTGGTAAARRHTHCQEAHPLPGGTLPAVQSWIRQAPSS